VLFEKNDYYAETAVNGKQATGFRARQEMEPFIYYKPIMSMEEST
jgi:hypothetical protein